MCFKPCLRFERGKGWIFLVLLFFLIYKVYSSIDNSLDNTITGKNV